MRNDERPRSVDEATGAEDETLDASAFPARDPSSTPKEGDADLQALDSRTDGSSQAHDAERDTS